MRLVAPQTVGIYNRNLRNTTNSKFGAWWCHDWAAVNDYDGSQINPFLPLDRSFGQGDHDPVKLPAGLCGIVKLRALDHPHIMKALSHIMWFTRFFVGLYINLTSLVCCYCRTKGPTLQTKEMMTVMPSSDSQGCKMSTRWTASFSTRISQRWCLERIWMFMVERVSICFKV